MQGLLRSHGVSLSRKQLALDQNGDLAVNLTPQAATALHRSGLINDSQFGVIAQGGSARFSFAHNDLLVSSSTGFQRSARNDTSTRFEAGKQAGPDTIEHFLGGGKEGHAAMANWLQGGFEMDRKGNWRLKPQVADTLERDVQAIMAQTGWHRTISRSAQDQNVMGTSLAGRIGGGIDSAGSIGRRPSAGKSDRSISLGRVAGDVSISSTETGTTSETGQATLDVLNFDVRTTIANAERAAARSPNPAKVFTDTLGANVLGEAGLRNRYLEQADSGRGTADINAPLTSVEQSAVLGSGRFSDDLAHGPTDGDSTFKKRWCL